jgi:hypothetical protein
MNGALFSRHSLWGLVALAVAILCVTPSQAWAYVDPGSGSYLFQLAAAALLASLYTVRRQWQALVSALRGRTARAGDAAIPPQRSNGVE